LFLRRQLKLDTLTFKRFSRNFDQTVTDN
jgi:hypothetical protein